MIYPKFFLNIYYNVKYSQKETAKQHKLRYDPNNKKWYSKHELYNFHNGEHWVDLDNICLKFEILNIYKITDKYNKYYSEYDDTIKIFSEQVNEKLKLT